MVSMIYYSPVKTHVFGVILESACLSVCVQNTSNFVSHTPPTVLLSSPEHKVLRVSYCHNAVSVVRRASSTFWLVYPLEAAFSV